MNRLCVLLALTQVAWSHYTTTTGAPLRWLTEQVFVVMDEAGTNDVPGDVEFEALRLAMDTWNAVSCPHPRLVDGGLVSGVRPGQDTKKNLIIWVQDPADWSSPEKDYVIALTTLYYNDYSGVIAKFDMEFADFAYEFTATDIRPLVKTDIQNTATHEFGHVLGLDHSADRNATMYPTAMPGDLEKRTLDTDDIKGLCTLYFGWVASGELSQAEQETGKSGGGCATTRFAPSAAALLLLAALFLVGRKRFGSKTSLVLTAIVLTGPGFAFLTTEDGKPLHWSADRVDFAFDVQHGTEDIPGEIEWDVISTAMVVWNTVPCNQPVLVGSANKPTANTICFDCLPIPEKTVIAYTINTYDEATGEIQASSIIFNDKRSFTYGSQQVIVDLGSIAVHELGHALGLGHSDVFRATMYPLYMTTTTFARDLHRDDAEGLCKLYGGSLPEAWQSSWIWEDPPLPDQCTEGCDAIPTGLPSLQARWPTYEVPARRGCSASTAPAPKVMGLVILIAATAGLLWRRRA